MSKANKFSKIGKNDKAFTGLEAAIVLIAFVVVAAVFSYVMLGAGFFTSEKAKQVVHTGVDMATSSVQSSGDIVASADDGASTVNTVTITLQLTAGGNPIDLSKTIVSFQDASNYVPNAWDGSVADDLTQGTGVNWIHHSTTGNMIDVGDLVQLIVPVSADNVGPNDRITLTVIPPQGATLPITVTIPPAIQQRMALY